MTPSVVLGREDIAAHAERLAGEITRDHPNGVVLVGVLKGALLFLSDLCRAIDEIPVLIDFIAISRYAPDSGRVRIMMDLTTDIAGRDVILVEDLVDTGLTSAYLIKQLQSRGPRSVQLCALLNRLPRRIVPTPVHYCGAEIGDVFVLGAGLHAQDLYRNLPMIVEGDRAKLAAHPGIYIDELYGVGN